MSSLDLFLFLLNLRLLMFDIFFEIGESARLERPSLERRLQSLWARYSPFLRRATVERKERIVESAEGTEALDFTSALSAAGSSFAAALRFLSARLSSTRASSTFRR